MHHWTFACAASSGLGGQRDEVWRNRTYRSYSSLFALAIVMIISAPIAIGHKPIEPIFFNRADVIHRGTVSKLMMMHKVCPMPLTSAVCVLRGGGQGPPGFEASRRRRRNLHVAAGSVQQKRSGTAAKKTDFDLGTARGDAIARAKDMAKRKKKTSSAKGGSEESAQGAIRSERRTVHGAGGWEGVSKRWQSGPLEEEERVGGHLKKRAHLNPWDDMSIGNKGEIEGASDEKSGLAQGDGEVHSVKGHVRVLGSLVEEATVASKHDMHRKAVKDVKRRGQGASRQKRVHFTEGGRLLHNAVSQAQNVFDLLAALSVRMIPLQLGDYREKWKDPMPFHDYEGNFRKDKMEELVSKMDPNIAAMVLVRLFHLYRADWRRRVEDALSKPGRQRETGIFGKYNQLPHLLSTLISRITETAGRLQPETAVRVLEAASGLRFKPQLWSEKRKEGGSTLIHSLVASVVKPAETSLEPTQAVRALSALGRFNDDDYDPGWNSYTPPQGETLEGILTLIDLISAKQVIDSLDPSDIVTLFEACSGLRMPHEDILKHLSDKIWSPLSPNSIFIEGLRDVNVSIEEMREQAAPLSTQDGAYTWHGRVFCLRRDQWGRRLDIVDGDRNATVYKYGTFSSHFKAQDIVIILSSMSTLEYLNLHAISSLLLRASHPQVVRAFDGREVCRLIQSMARLAILKGDTSPDQVWIPFSEEEAEQMWASIRARCGVNMTSSWQSRWRTEDGEGMQVSNRQKRKLKDDPTRRPFYSVPHVRESLGTVLDSLTQSPKGMQGTSPVDCAGMVWGLAVLRPTKKTHLRVIACIRGMGFWNLAQAAYSLLPASS